MKIFPKCKKTRIWLNLALYVYAIISIYPIVWMLFYSLKNNDEIFFTNPFGIPKHFRFENYITALSQFNVPSYFLNSVITSLLTVVGTVILSVLFSYSTARMEWKLKNVARIYMMLGMFIPLQVVMIPLAILVKDLHLTNTRAALIIPYIAFNLSFSTMVFYGFMRSIPNELEEAAYMDGAGIFRTFFSIILPLLKPAIATVSIFVLLNAWNEFTMALILISDEKLKTLPLGLLFFQGQFTTNWGAMGAAMFISSIPTLLMYLFFSEKVENALTVGGAVKG